MTKWDYDDIINTAWWHGNSEGREEGLAEGREEGLAEGLTNGRLDMAKKMKALGVSPEIICQTSGLRAEEVKAL